MPGLDSDSLLGMEVREDFAAGSSGRGRRWRVRRRLAVHGMGRELPSGVRLLGLCFDDAAR